MTLALRGIGWVTPLGFGLDEVWERLKAGECAPVAKAESPNTGKCSDYLPVSAKPLEWLGRAPRIRRSGSITYFTLAAGLGALQNAGLLAVDAPTPLAKLPAGLPLDPAIASRTALVFAICNGGVNYTRRFYEKVVSEGPPGASPLLFPETVYNAPASHMAALLGIDGACYTLVGDATVGLEALHFAGQLLATQPGLEQCLVVGGEEHDWVLSEAYAAWRLLARNPHAPGKPRGMRLAEGACALVVGRAGMSGREIQVDTFAVPYSRRDRAGAALDTVLSKLPVWESDLVVGSANGTWIDAVEAVQLARHLPDSPTFFPKAILGESFAASSLIQLAVGALALTRDEMPAAHPPAASTQALRKIAVTAIGLNQQAAGAVVRPYHYPQIFGSGLQR